MTSKADLSFASCASGTSQTLRLSVKACLCWRKMAVLKPKSLMGISLSCTEPGLAGIGSQPNVVCSHDPATALSREPATFATAATATTVNIAVVADVVVAAVG